MTKRTLEHDCKELDRLTNEVLSEIEKLRNIMTPTIRDQIIYGSLLSQDIDDFIMEEEEKEASNKTRE